MLQRKRGKLSLEEEKFITVNAPKMAASEIADALGRTEETVHKFCKTHGISHMGMSDQVSEDVGLVKVLEGRPYWKEVCKQFSENELEYFQMSWIRLFKQFKEDLLYSEELQLKQMITHEIMGNRVLQDRKKAIAQIERLEAQINDMYDSGENETDSEKVQMSEQELSIMRGSISSFTKEHGEIQKQIKDIQKDMKAARSDRITKVMDSKSSFSGLLKFLDDEEERRKLGENTEIMRMAKDKAKVRLSQYHKFEDGFVDQPFLTPETLIEEDYDYATTEEE